MIKLNRLLKQLNLQKKYQNSRRLLILAAEGRCSLLQKMFDYWLTWGWEFDRSHGACTSSPSHWQQVEEQAPKPVGWMMCFLLMTFVPVQKLCVNIYIYIYIAFLYGFCYRMYIYMQQECHSVLVKLHPITFYRTVFLGSTQFLGWMPLFVFFGLPIVSCSLMIIV